ncbi:MAG: MFS transporter [Cytophagaceae bacterium]
MTNKKSLAILFTANGVAGFAQGLTMLAIPWYFTVNNQANIFIAYFAVVTLLSLFWGLYAGALIDGFNRKDVFLGTNVVGGLIVFSVSSLGFKEGVLPTELIVLVFTTTFLGYVIHYPNLYAFAQELSDPKDYTKITSIIEIVGQSTAIGGAVMGTMFLDGLNKDISFLSIGLDWNIHVTIPKLEIHEIFLFDAVAYFVSFIIILLIEYNTVMGVSHNEEGTLYERLKSGYDYLMKNQLVLLFGICSYAIFVVVLVEIFCLIPLYVKNNLGEGAEVIGLVEFMYATGSLLSGIVIQTLFSRMPLLKAILIITFMTAGVFFLSSFTSSVMIYLGVALMKGFANAGSRIFRVSYLFALIPNELAGRVNSFFNVINTLFRLFFIVLFVLPFFEEGNNIIYAYFILASFCVAAGLILVGKYHDFDSLTAAAKKPNNH